MAIENEMKYSVNSIEVFYRIIGILSSITGAVLKDFKSMNYNEIYYDTPDQDLFKSNRTLRVSSCMKVSPDGLYKTKLTLKSPIKSDDPVVIGHLKRKELELSYNSDKYYSELSDDDKHFIREKYPDIDPNVLIKSVKLYKKRQTCILSSMIEKYQSTFDTEVAFDELFYDIGDGKAVCIFQVEMEALNETMNNTEDFNAYMESITDVLKERVTLYDDCKISMINLTKYQIGIEILKKINEQKGNEQDDLVTVPGEIQG